MESYATFQMKFGQNRIAINVNNTQPHKDTNLEK